MSSFTIDTTNWLYRIQCSQDLQLLNITQEHYTCDSLCLACVCVHFPEVEHYLFLFTGNKCDLESERQVEFNEACTLAKQKEIIVALETSAKEAQNVDQAFIVMAHELLARNGLAVKEDSYQVDSPRILLRSNTKAINSPTNTVEKKQACEC